VGVELSLQSAYRCLLLVSYSVYYYTLMIEVMYSSKADNVATQNTVLSTAAILRTSKPTNNFLPHFGHIYHPVI
jgi:hypothetical protein